MNIRIENEEFKQSRQKVEIYLSREDNTSEEKLELDRAIEMANSIDQLQNEINDFINGGPVENKKQRMDELVKKAADLSMDIEKLAGDEQVAVIAGKGRKKSWSKPVLDNQNRELVRELDDLRAFDLKALVECVCSKYPDKYPDADALVRKIKENVRSTIGDVDDVENIAKLQAVTDLLNNMDKRKINDLTASELIVLSDGRQLMNTLVGALQNQVVVLDKQDPVKEVDAAKNIFDSLSGAIMLKQNPPQELAAMVDVKMREQENDPNGVLNRQAAETDVLVALEKNARRVDTKDFATRMLLQCSAAAKGAQREIVKAAEPELFKINEKANKALSEIVDNMLNSFNLYQGKTHEKDAREFKTFIMQIKNGLRDGIDIAAPDRGRDILASLKAKLPKTGRINNPFKREGDFTRLLKREIEALEASPLLKITPDAIVVLSEYERPLSNSQKLDDLERSVREVSDTENNAPMADNEPGGMFDEFFDLVNEAEKGAEALTEKKAEGLTEEEFLNLATPPSSNETPAATAKEPAPKVDVKVEAEQNNQGAPRQKADEKGKTLYEINDSQKLVVLKNALEEYLKSEKNPRHRHQAQSMITVINSTQKKQPLDLSLLVVNVQQAIRDNKRSSLAKFIGIADMKGGRFGRILSVFNNVAMENPDLCKSALSKMQANFDSESKNNLSPAERKKLQADFEKDSSVLKSAIAKIEESSKPKQEANSGGVTNEAEASASTPRPR